MYLMPMVCWQTFTPFLHIFSTFNSMWNKFCANKIYANKKKMLAGFKQALKQANRTQLRIRLEKFPTKVMVNDSKCFNTFFPFNLRGSFDLTQKCGPLSTRYRYNVGCILFISKISVAWKIERIYKTRNSKNTKMRQFFKCTEMREYWKDKYYNTHFSLHLPL